MIAPIEHNAGKRGAPIYQLEVVLSGSHPPIWRRLQAPGDANLGWLHAVLQIAIGWTNSHLHQFIAGENTYSDPSFEMDQCEGVPSILDERKVKLTELLPAPGESLFYEYDFGDSWEHLVTVGKILPPDPASASTALCLDGARACPPEDCGGLGGYEQLLKAIKNRKHPEHKTMKEWLGRPFDAETFDMAKANHALSRLKWPRATEAQLRKILMARDGYKQ